MKKKCRECGHLSIITDGKETIFGCSGVKIILKEMDYTGDNVEAIDTTFRLNKDNDCFLWLEQTDKQKEDYQKMSKSILKRIKSFFNI